jgi:beta propeller repeat protein
MEIKGKLYSITLASTALVFVSLILISAASSAQVTKIGSGSDPAIYGSKVVWTDDGVIHVYDLTAKKDITVSSSSASYPAIYGSKLVWHDGSGETPRLVVYDISTAAKTYITRNVDQYSRPAIFGNRIVWSAGYSVYMRDISTSTQTRIAYGNDPDIFDNKIVYSSEIAGNTPQIYVYDITTGETIDASQYGDNYYPHIYGNKVIWSDFYTRLGNIRMYDIATEQQTEVTTGDYMTGYDTGGATDIYDNRIVYLKHNDLGEVNLGDVYVYDIDTEQSTQLSSGNTAQTPVIYGNIVVWSDSGNIIKLSLCQRYLPTRS